MTESPAYVTVVLRVSMATNLLVALEEWDPSNRPEVRHGAWDAASVLQGALGAVGVLGGDGRFVGEVEVGTQRLVP